MAEYDTVLRGRHVITVEGQVARWVGVVRGRIAAVEPYDAPFVAAQTIELGDETVLLPGFIDTHVHVNEPGRTEWEGFGTATRAAAAGGITTIIDMPINSVPPTTDVAALEAKRRAAKDQCHVDVGFWGGAIPGNAAELRRLHDAGVFGFKCFLVRGGIDEFPPLSLEELKAALLELATFDGLMIVHAEDSDVLDKAPKGRGRRYRDFLASSPHAAEDAAIMQVIELARRTGVRLHILHLSSSNALPMINAARSQGTRLTTETCPHYLYFSAEEIPDGATQFKCAPPIREAANRELLWQGLADGTIDAIVSDHCPCTPDLKHFDTGDFSTAWGGISSIQLGLAVVWSQAQQRGYTLSDIVKWMAEAPARIAGLEHKGRIAVGYDADFTVFAPDEPFVVDPNALYHKHPETPYVGQRLLGIVRETWLRGEPIKDKLGGRLLVRTDV